MTSGNRVEDETGRHPGQLSLSGAEFVDGGVSGRAVALRREGNGYVSFGDVLPLLNTAYTISLWIKVEKGDVTPFTSVITKHRPGSANGYWIILNTSVGPVSAFGGSEPVITVQSALNDGAWHHLAMVRSEFGAFRLYVDGNSDTMIGNMFVNPSPAVLLLGGMDLGSPSGSFSGLIDDVQIYGEAVTENEVEILYRSPGVSLPLIDVLSLLPPSGPTVSRIEVAMATTIIGGQIRYTEDGTEPTSVSTLYAGPFPVFVTRPVRIRARVYVNGFPTTDIREVNYLPDMGIHIQPEGGTFTNSVDVVLQTRIRDAVIRYTLDGREPDLESPIFQKPLRFAAHTSIRARAFLGRFPVSEVAAADFKRLYHAAPDGIPDAWRERYFGPDYRFDARSPADEDPDRDGSVNLQEFLGGTDPTNANSGFRVGAERVTALVFPSVPGERFRIHRRSSLGSADTVVVGEVVAASDITRFADLSGESNDAAFYLVERVQAGNP